MLVMDVVLEILEVFSSTVPNAGLLLLFPLAVFFMSGLSMGVTALGETLDVRDEQLRREQQIKEMLEKYEEEMESGNQKMIEQGR